MSGTVSAYIDGTWQYSYTSEEFRMSVLDKIERENIWHGGFSRHLNSIFSMLSSVSVNLFVEGMNLIDCVWQSEESGLRIDVGGEDGDCYYFVIKVGPKYGLALHGIGDAKCFDAKSCQINNASVLKELESYLNIVIKAVKGRKEFNDTVYKARLAYTTKLDLLGVNVNWRGSGHTDLL